MFKCVLALFFPALGAMVVGESAGQSQPEPLLGRITRAVLAAKQQGLTEVSLPALSVMKMDVNTLERAAKYSIFLAHPVSTAVTASAHSMTTWYTLQTDEILIKKKADAVNHDSTPPLPLESLAAGQLLLPISGGQAVVDGIVVRLAPDFGLRLRMGKKYVFVLDLKKGGRIGQLVAQDDGIFELSQDGFSIKSLRRSGPLGQDVQARWAGQLDAVRAFLKSRASAQEKP
jgi:hypothetical protein